MPALSANCHQLSQPYQLKSASGGSAPRDGSLTTSYDGAGNMVGLSVIRNASAPCVPSGSNCSARYVYDWDEVGRLSRARRWDGNSLGIATDPTPTGTAVADLRYEYDASDDRVRKTAVDASSGLERHTECVFDSLELRRATFDVPSGEYARTNLTEVPYLFAHGVRLARVHYATSDVPTLTSGQTHVLLELPDHLGSTAVVIDRSTSELVERSSHQAYGATESDYRPDRWDSVRDDYRFTGSGAGCCLPRRARERWRTASRRVGWRMNYVVRFWLIDAEWTRFTAAISCVDRSRNGETNRRDGLFELAASCC